MSAQGEREDWTALARSAARGDEESAPEEMRQLLVFQVADASYALPVESVREIVRQRATTPIPRAPADVRGVISLRGEILQVIDLRRRIGAAPAEPTRRARIVVVQAEDSGIAGLLVDGVREVLRTEQSAVQLQGGGDGMVAGLVRRGDAFVSLIDLERVLDLHAES
ncbi:MAG TPA: chemotaxis protein CheW [Myxococcota bacterium]|jgi:chemotaxis signal transduction protein|nr:chemotaxis protein CheW [Myxococcota bacterium]